MKVDDSVVKLVQSGMLLEKDGKIKEAQDVFMKAWESASNEKEKCIAAHFVARNQIKPEESLMWNLEALAKAEKVWDEEIKSYYPSLYLCVGISYEDLKNYSEAKKYYDLAFENIPNLPKNKNNEVYNKRIVEDINDRRSKILKNP